MQPIISGQNGYGNDDIAINAALQAGSAIMLEGDYYISNPILVPYSGVNGANRAIISNNACIYGNAANMLCLHWADSHARLIGHLSLRANNQGVHLMHLTPELEGNNNTVVNQNYNVFDSLGFYGGDEQLVIMAGKPVGGTDSGCWYNSFNNAYFTSGKRAIWFKDNGHVGAGGSGSNSNHFKRVIINGSCNTGVQIDAGGGNIFSDINLENINLGNSPNAIPTGVVIKNNMLNGGANPKNEFYIHCENVTKKYDIQNFTTVIDDKDERSGFFTASLTSDAGGFGLSYNRIGWEKRGNIITISGLFVVNSISGSPSGRMYISLPFTAAGTTGNDYQHRVSVSVAANLLATNGIPVQARILEGTNKIELGLEGSWGSLADKISVGADFTINATFRVNY